MAEQVRTATLTIKNDLQGTYKDSMARDSVSGDLGSDTFTWAVVSALAARVARDSGGCGREDLKLLGRGLFRLAFGDPVRRGADGGWTTAPLREAFEFTLQNAKDNRTPVRLRLVIGRDAARLAGLPWEFLYFDDDDHGYFLAGEKSDLVLTRYVPNQDRWTVEGQKDARLRILVVDSRPRIPGMTEIDVGGFVSFLSKLDPKRFAVDTIESPHREELRKRVVEARPHVVHFIGHGKPGAIALKSAPSDLTAAERARDDLLSRGGDPGPLDEADWADGESARGIFGARADGPSDRDYPRMVFLHACEGASSDAQPGARANNLARQVAEGDGIAGVVAMQYPIGVEEAEKFATCFYTHLSAGEELCRSVSTARRELAEWGMGGAQAWNHPRFGAPVIYLRFEDPFLVPALGTPPFGPDRTAGAMFTAPNRVPCPNPLCPDAWIRPDASVPYCRVCQKPYVKCPWCDRGYMVAEAAARCDDCNAPWFDAARGREERTTTDERAPEGVAAASGLSGRAGLPPGPMTVAAGSPASRAATATGIGAPGLSLPATLSSPASSGGWLSMKNDESADDASAAEADPDSTRGRSPHPERLWEAS